MSTESHAGVKDTVAVARASNERRPQIIEVENECAVAPLQETSVAEGHRRGGIRGKGDKGHLSLRRHGLRRVTQPFGSRPDQRHPTWGKSRNYVRNCRCHNPFNDHLPDRLWKDYNDCERATYHSTEPLTISRRQSNGSRICPVTTE